jgi:predicted dithiol-disulfide oxidoreductase (DUF899 family)
MKRSAVMKPLPPIVSQQEWQLAQERMLALEKQATQAHDALAAERRRQPMVRIDKHYVFEGLHGKVRLPELFEGRRQLLVYHFMFAPDVHGWPDAGCPGCSMFVDNLGHPSHLHARDTSLALVSRAPLANIERYRHRMGWERPWYSSEGSDFNRDMGATNDQGEVPGLSVFLRDDDEVFRTYFATARGLEPVGTVWTLLDLTPYGRQENWEASPKGWPQTEPYQWWRRHDEYGTDHPAH